MLMKIVFALMVLVSIVYAVTSIDRENPVSQRLAQQELDNLRGFAFSVMRFVAANYAYEGVVNWMGENNAAALRDASTTPESLRGMMMPLTWHAKVSNSDYLLCVQLSEAALSLMAKEMPEAITANVLQTNLPGQSVVAFATAEDLTPKNNDEQSEAELWAASCTQ